MIWEHCLEISRLVVGCFDFGDDYSVDMVDEIFNGEFNVAADGVMKLGK